DVLKGKQVGVNVISKSGTTTETALAFRFIRRLMEESFGDQAADLILVTTDAQKGALRQLALKKGYQTFVVPDDVGGRYSVLTEVGLVGLAVAGVDIEAFAAGFEAMRRRTETEDFWQNPALVLAASRVAAHNAGKQIEVVAANSAALFHLARWMEQLFPESEGQQGQGLWVSPSLYSEKLHANGQMVQEGRRNLIETFLYLKEADNSLTIPPDPDNIDGLNYLSDRGATMEELNRLVIEGPAYAHFLAGTPSLSLIIPRRHPYCLGQVYYLLERSVAVSGYLLGLNPFIQPGVEAYKQAIFALAGRPGYEDKGRQIEAALEARERIVV
ncbi:MAG: glucose-6-phosphate isomerase, partial [Deltaproteobacteria bacterium]|nr:glucose-6-phosphate isomerase [Deltaproteobacteria bacterium]